MTCFFTCFTLRAVNPLPMSKPKYLPTPITGILFLLPLLAYGTGSYLIGSVTADPDQLFVAGSGRVQLLSGALLVLLNSLAVTALAACMYPILSRYHQKTALWYLGTRITEAVILIVGLIALLSLFMLSEDTTGVPRSDPDSMALLYRIGQQGNFLAYQLAMIVLGAGSIPACFLFVRLRLLPFFLSIAGIAGYFLLALGACLELFGFKVGVLLSVPGGLFELALGLWLIFKGFRERQPLNAFRTPAVS